MKKPFFLLFLSLTWGMLLCQAPVESVSIQRAEPPFWWAGMVHPELQVLLYGPGVGNCRARIDYPGVTLSRSTTVTNPKYLFLELSLAPNVRPGELLIELLQDNRVVATYPYSLRARQVQLDAYRGFDASDVLYLLMPDRFANGDPGNDQVPGMLESPNREDPTGRHGGDLKGILDHLDYLKDLGVTTLWVNPLLENNMQRTSYHGYAITDFYKTDPRYGSNEQYKQLVEQVHRRGMKMVMDVVLNHCGSDHWFIQDLPAADWINQWPVFTRTNYHISLLTDPYVSDYDREQMLAGWFDVTMPDLNQRNPLLKEYLIQNCIWWIEYAGLDGMRLDTQPYSYPEAVSEWASRIRSEYPDFGLVGESWAREPHILAYWQGGAHNSDGYDSHIPSVMDFPLHFAVAEVFHEPESWNTGLVRLFNLLGEDFVYADPERLLVFPDNHDGDRFFTLMGENLDPYKMGLTFLLTVRGIPQIYYGTEVLMTGLESSGHGNIRKDFPGGWPGDTRNAFSAKGRTAIENEAFDHLQRLLTWRKNKQVIHSGKFRHFKPQDGVYVYFRYDEEATVMVLINNDPEKEQLVGTHRFTECIRDFTQAEDVLTGEKIRDLRSIRVGPKMARILELK